jgi:hypothetical protein
MMNDEEKIPDDKEKEIPQDPQPVGPTGDPGPSPEHDS